MDGGNERERRRVGTEVLLFVLCPTSIGSCTRAFSHFLLISLLLLYLLFAFFFFFFALSDPLFNSEPELRLLPANRSGQSETRYELIR